MTAATETIKRVHTGATEEESLVNKKQRLEELEDQRRKADGKKKPAGKALDDIDEACLDVNTLKGELQKEKEDWKGDSKFDSEKDKTKFRQYEDACERVKNFYKEQHAKQTVAFNLQARVDLKSRTRAKMTIWEALEKLNTLIDESDPDTELSQIEHALQTAEAMRRDGKPRWMILTGILHDMGKLLYFFDYPEQWMIVGDTHPVGCAFDERIIYPEYFKENPDHDHPIYSTKMGIYNKGCGMENVMLSWGHDEYMYNVCARQSKLPEEALAMIRYHSFYAWHREGAYREFMNDHDWKMLEAVQAFNPYDLYSKSDERVDVDKLKPFYLELIDEFFPQKVINW